MTPRRTPARPAATPSAVLAALALAATIACGDLASSGTTTDVALARPDAASDADGSADTDGSADADPGDTDPGDTDPSDTDTARPALLGAAELIARVDPFIGTGGEGFGYAAMTPAAQRPLGWVRLGPDTTRGGGHPAQTHFSGYFHADPDIRGFSHTHFVGTGVADYGNLRALPLTQLDDRAPGSRFVGHEKSEERAWPGGYRTTLSNGTQAELTTAHFVGLHRYTWPNAVDDPERAGSRILQLDFASSVRDSGIERVRVVPTDNGVEGEIVFRGGYVGRSNPFTLYVSATISEQGFPNVWDSNGLRDATGPIDDAEGGIFWDFGAGDEPVELRVGLSLISLDNARTHREAVAAQSFDEVTADALDEWTERLEGVRIATDDPRVQTIFATAAYNAWRMPSRWDEHDGRYFGLDAAVHEGIGGPYYTDLSLWDTYRTLHPWYDLVAPDVQRDCLRSLLAMTRDLGGRMPRWPAAASATGGMLGESATILFGGSAAKRLEGIDWGAALDVLWEANFGNLADPPGPFGRQGGLEYTTLGWVADDLHGDSVSLTLEYAWNDLGLANVAEAAGDNEREALSRARAGSWANLLDDDGFAMPRRADGTLDDTINPTTVYQNGGPYTEGSAWHWRFYGLHDLDAFAATLGPERLGDALETFFARSALGEGEGPVSTFLPDRYYWHGNEPAIHAAYLFHGAGRYDRLTYWVRQVQNRLYHDTPAGIPGNDDGGTLSAWYLFSALGLYPIAGSADYLLGTPLVERAEIDLADGTTLRIEAPGASAGVWEVASVTRNGRPIEGGRLRHADLSDATLRFEMVTP